MIGLHRAPFRPALGLYPQHGMGVSTLEENADAPAAEPSESVFGFDSAQHAEEKGLGLQYGMNSVRQCKWLSYTLCHVKNGLDVLLGWILISTFFLSSGLISMLST